MGAIEKNRLDYEIAAIKNEILSIKAWKQKVAGQLKTVKYTVPIEFTLDLDINDKLVSTKIACVEITPYQDVQGGVLVSYGLNVDDLEQRVIWTIGGIDGNDRNYQFQFYINDTENPNDSIGTKVNYTVTIVSTALADVEVTYKEP